MAGGMMRNDREQGPNRRAVLAGLAALAAAGPAEADETSPVANGVLTENPVAKAFEKIPGNPALPDVPLNGLKGDCRLSDFKGRTLIVPIWAEWCTPCLSELPDFARLQRKYGNTEFAIVPVLSGPYKQMTPAVTAQILGYLHADIFEPLVEQHFGGRLLQTMARQPQGGLSIPCNLLIAPSGKVVARETGKIARTEQPETPPKTGNETGEDAKRIKAWQSSLWSTVYGEEFAAALAAGFLAGR